MNIFIRLFSDFMTVTGAVICWNSCLDKKSFKSKNDFLAIFILTICIYLSSILIPNPIKILINYILLSFVNYCFISKNIKQSLILVIISQFIGIIVELFFVFIL